MDPYTSTMNLMDMVNEGNANRNHSSNNSYGMDPYMYKFFIEHVAPRSPESAAHFASQNVNNLYKTFDTTEDYGQFDALRHDNWNATQIRVRDALKAGINPLAALGVSSNVQPTVSSSKYSDGRKSNAMSGFISFMRDMLNLRRESAELDNESKRIANDIARDRRAHVRQVGIDNSSAEQPPLGTDSMLFRVVYDLDGAPRLMVNQDITENDGDNAGYRSSLVQALKAGLINPITGRVKSKQYLMFIDDMHRRHTGRPIMNLDRLYVSPVEFGLVAADELKGWLR